MICGIYCAVPPTIFEPLRRRRRLFDDELLLDELEPEVLEPDVLEPEVLEPDVLEPDVLEPDVLFPEARADVIVAVVGTAYAAAAIDPMRSNAARRLRIFLVILSLH